ncbi:MAG: acyltransferase [Bacteroides sp.]|nr:acyltransferase [Bacteroides sp.]MBD5376031.1 acyltransferase [Bacteroides sp.]
MTPIDFIHLIKRIRIKLYSSFYSYIFHTEKLSICYPINRIKGEQYFLVGKNCSFGIYTVLTAWDKYDAHIFHPSVKIGNNCSFGDFLHLTCCNSISIGNNVLTGRWVTITDNSHGYTDYQSLRISPIHRKLISPGAIQIGDNVWIGDKVTILPNVEIGEGCIIGANAVVTNNIPPYSVVGGNPAKVIKTSYK